MSTTTLNKKQKIITESDRLLADFKSDIKHLSQRVKALESKEANVEKLLITNQNLTNHLDYNYQRQKKLTNSKTEEYKVLNTILDDLKNPVTKVVSNLGQIKAEISDEKLQSSLQDCLNTAKSVLASFNETTKYVGGFAQNLDDHHENLDLRLFLRDLLRQINQDTSKFQLFVDSQVPEKIMVKTGFLKKSLTAFIKTILDNSQKNTQLTITAGNKSLTNSSIKNGVDIKIQIKSNHKTNLKWSGSWLDSVSLDNQSTDKIPLNWVKYRHDLQKYHGDLILLKKDGYLTGVEIDLPLLYSNPLGGKDK
ncbi:MAG: hypothetical protein JJV97_02585 [SAR324 cluster bacterium]|nr:hypothetical protein [SAR324 cluster bacterium]